MALMCQKALMRRILKDIVSLLLAIQIICAEAFLLLPQTQHATYSRCSVVVGASKDESNGKDSKKVVVIGGGWAGFTAADALATSEECIEIELLDASPRGPGGLAGGWRTPKLNRPVEAGLHGFWREYKNTFAAIERIGLSLDDVLTPFTPSILVSKSGRVALAPVLGTQEGNTSSDWQSQKNLSPRSPEELLSMVGDLLPPPLDVALLSDFDANSKLTVADRISGIGLLGAWADFEQENPESWKKYDKISAENLFRSSAGVTTKLYDELVSPLLHVLPMTPGYDCSAAAALSCFHVFALQSRGAFDVRWCRGTISEKIFNPWAEKLVSTGCVNIRGAAKVTSIKETGSAESIRYSITVNDNEKIECDAVVLAVGGTAIKRMLRDSPTLAGLPGAIGWEKFRGVTCVAVRLFLKPAMDEKSKPAMIPLIERAMNDSPVVVCGPAVGNIPELTETGFCIYDLQRLHDEFKVSSDTDCIGLEVDFFRADALAEIEDDSRIAEIALQAISSALAIDDLNAESLIVDLSVVRAKNAVSHFCVDSASWSPDVKLKEGMYICGDWIDRSGHASWSTEKSVVTARQAVASLAKDLSISCETSIIPAAPDTSQLSALRQLARLVRKSMPAEIIPAAPWVLLKQLLGR